MEIRKLNAEDFVQHNKVSSQSFVYCCDIYADTRMPSKNMIGAFQNGILTADLEIQTRLCNYYGDTLCCALVGGVASKPEYRNMGAVRQLFNFLFEGKAADDKYDISILYPFSEAYYRQFGYENMGKKISFSVDYRELSHIEKNNDVVLCENEQVEALLKLYNETAAKTNLTFVREDGNNFSLEPYKTTVYTYMHKDGAFAVYGVDREKGVVTVKQIGYKDKKSLLGILGFLRCYEGNIPQIAFEDMPVNTPVLSCLKGATEVFGSFKSVGSLRIINIKNVLEKKKYPKHKGGFTLFVQDDNISENSGFYTVEYADTRARVTKSQTGKADLSLSAPALAALVFCGVRDESEIEFLHGAQLLCENQDLFDAFPTDTPFFNDPF